MAPSFVIAEELTEEQKKDFQNANVVRKVPKLIIRSLVVVLLV